MSEPPGTATVGEGTRRRTVDEARPFRFGYQLPPGDDPEDLRDRARRAEAAGFDVLHTADHLLPEAWPPLLGLQAVADVTESIRLCPLVVNNDFHHPVNLAQEVAALDRLSGGRAELGIGAGHSFTEYEAVGQPFDPPGLRKERMAEAVGLIRRLLDGEVVDHQGEHHRLEGARTMTPVQAHLPILIGVNGGREALARAVGQADTIGLTMTGRTLADGQRHEVRWEAERLDRVTALLHGEMQAQGRSVELHALVQVVKITDDREAATRDLLGALPGLTLDDALSTPFLAVGCVAEVADHLRRVRDRWGISYITVRSIDAFAPVIAELRRTP